MDLSEINAQNPFRHPWEIARADFLIKQIKNLAPKRVIDIGSGDGYLGQRILDNINAEVVFIDPLFSEERLNLPNHYRSLKEIKIKQDDMILLADVLEHIEKPDEFLQDVLTYFPSGTKVLVTTPAFNSLMSEHDIKLKHFRRYNQKELIAQLSPWIEVVRARYFFFLPLIIRTIQKITFMNMGEGISNWRSPATHWKTKTTRFLLGMDLRLKIFPGLSVMVLGRTK